MRKLIGKIFKEDDGKEVIEREPEIESKWIVESSVVVYPKEDTIGFAYEMRCPYCDGKTKMVTESRTVRDRLMEEAKFAPKNKYCGYCGHLMIRGLKELKLEF